MLYFEAKRCSESITIYIFHIYDIFQATPTDYIPPPPPVPEAPVDVVPDVLNAIGEPTLQSVGLGGLSPPGLVQQGLDFLHVSLGLPWWGAIIAGKILKI